jgi:hypothetical protein
VRMLSIGVAVGLANLFASALAPQSAAHAAYPSGSGYASQVKRPLFRPTQGTQFNRAGTRWRPYGVIGAARAPVKSTQRRLPFAAMGGSSKVGPGAPAGNRNAERAAVLAPPQRGVDQQFRPNGRLSTRDLPVADIAMPAADMRRSALLPEFRPARDRARKTYEELRATAAPSRQGIAGDLMPYAPSSVPLLPGYGRYWPAW